jgi:hypothetical protein
MTDRKPAGASMLTEHTTRNLLTWEPKSWPWVCLDLREPPLSPAASVCSFLTGKSREKLLLGTNVSEDYSCHGVIWSLKGKCVTAKAPELGGRLCSICCWDAGMTDICRFIDQSSISLLLSQVNHNKMYMYINVGTGSHIYSHLVMCNHDVFSHTNRHKHIVVFITETLKRYLNIEVGQMM